MPLPTNQVSTVNFEFNEKGSTWCVAMLLSFDFSKQKPTALP